MPLGMEVGLSLCDFVLDGDSINPLPKKGRSPQFSAHVYCICMAKRLHGSRCHLVRTTQVNVGSGDVVRWGRSSP